MRKVTVGSIQMAMSWDKEKNLAKAEKLVREAAKKGARIILPELFGTPYFCQEKNYDHYHLATPIHDNPAVLHFKPIAKELDIVLPISFYEIDGNSLFNTVAMIDTNGEVMGSNRIGEEKVFPSKNNNEQESSLNFYGSSFIADETGEVVEEAHRDQEEILIHTFDLDAIKEMRLSWGVFRDRRPEAYTPIMKNK